MRNVPSYISERLKKNIQTRANDSAPSARIWISRPSTVLVDERLLERQTVLNSSITDVSIAVGHPRMRRSNANIFVAYISGSVARVATAIHKLNMDAHTWRDTGFNEDATAVSIAFDGTMPRVYGSEVEFVTEPYPWVFWVSDSVLYGQKLYSKDDPIVLAETNCSDVSAIRAMWSSTGGFDFGLVVFFILSGQLYYRQLIDGEWMDAELVSFGPDSVEWKEVSTFRSWDYRIGVQVKATNGDIYELYTQFMGVGKQLTEHLAVSVEPKADNIAINYAAVKDDEHIETRVIPAPEPIEAWNVDSEGTEIALRFSQPLIGDITGYETPVGYTQRNIDLSKAIITTLNQYSTSYTGAKAIDGSTSTYWRGTTAVNWIQFQLPEAKVVTHMRMYMGSYYIKTFTVSGSNDGETWTQIGGTYTGASSTTAKWYDIDIENEEPYLYYRIDTLTAYSTRIYLYEVELQETVAVGNETKVTVTGKTYEYVPGGELEDTSRTAVAVSTVSEITTDPEDNAVVYLKFADGNVNSIRNMVGDVSIAYSGGTWRGLGGPVTNFEFEFTPNNLEPKHHPHDAEHIAADINVNATLTRIYYTDASETEHIEVAVNPVADLISVDDI